jgi:hypothetical protein
VRPLVPEEGMTPAPIGETLPGPHKILFY